MADVIQLKPRQRDICCELGCEKPATRYIEITDIDDKYSSVERKHFCIEHAPSWAKKE